MADKPVPKPTPPKVKVNVTWFGKVIKQVEATRKADCCLDKKKGASK